MFFSVDERQQRLKKSIQFRTKTQWLVSLVRFPFRRRLGTHRERNSRTHLVKDGNIPPRTSLFQQLQAS